MSISRQIASYLIKTKYEDMPSEAVEFTKLCVLDWLASALAGREEPPIQMIHQVVRESGGNPQATLVTGERSSVLNAALVNGASSHVVELDDIHKASIIHAATVVIPAALAVAEWKKLSGKDLLLAVALGYEVCYRVGEAVSPSHYYYWHNTATCGTFGAAAAAAKLLGLNENQIVQALGNAGTQAAGLWEFIEDGAMSKQLHPGKAAMNGVLAALLAEKGFTGAECIFEGKRGFFQAMSEQYDASKMTEGLGTTFKITENSFKIHASCRHTHHAMDLAQVLCQERQLKPSDVKAIRVKTYRAVVNITDNPDPNTVYASKFSLQYCVALALLTGKTSLPDFSEEALYNEDIRDLMKRISVSIDPEVDAAYPSKWGAKFEIEFASGDKLTLTADYPKGDPENPVSAIELMDKFRALTLRLRKEEVEGFIDTVMNLEQVEDVQDFWMLSMVKGG
ncbi:MmgE/PrpD family protein [Aneurinibacillus tyrosinisolvens]|uniref:MmgE/PrpD family protein n=1 Tax=Aneurinibacillus tyrosinisolvens TaxID=1443435 RepID=UPI00063F2AA8|nr:MmgE/PrpD family protein [Aneurinibacillus tyrosinisolvens]